VSPFAEVLMKLALHDRLGDLQKNFVDGREMIELATCVLKSHVQSRDAHQPTGDVRNAAHCYACLSVCLSVRRRTGDDRAGHV